MPIGRTNTDEFHFSIEELAASISEAACNAAAFCSTEPSIQRRYGLFFHFFCANDHGSSMPLALITYGTLAARQIFAALYVVCRHKLSIETISNFWTLFFRK